MLNRRYHVRLVELVIAMAEQLRPADLVRLADGDLLVLSDAYSSASGPQASERIVLALQLLAGGGSAARAGACRRAADQFVPEAATSS